MQQGNSNVLHMLSFIGVAPTNLASLEDTVCQICELTLDSRQTNQHAIFIAVYGTQTSGHAFLNKAANAGCKLALVDTKNAAENASVKIDTFTDKSSLTCVYVYDLRQKLADIAYCFYQGNRQGFETELLPVVTAITGTNGKTSVASLMASMSSLCDQKSASIGTLGVNEYATGLLSKLADTINTTPDIISLISTLSRLSKRGCKRVALEASSHGLAQDRLQKLEVKYAVFTNLSQDHLDYHDTMADYAKAKRKLLSVAGLSGVILNADDAESNNWQKESAKKHQLFWYSMNQLAEQRMGCWASHIVYTTSGISFNLHAKFPAFTQSLPVKVKLIGAFNVSNLLASVTALLAQGFSFSKLASVIPHVGSVAGRMELFESAKASLLVDYAHTPDALKQALKAARVHTKGQLSCVFGCGGDRDTSKRAIMGEVAAQYADNIVLTQDNSRSEDPLQIIADIKKGMNSLSPKQKLCVELDREQAILRAWQGSQKSDMILVAGKGHEDYIEINDTRIAYNERQAVSTLASQSLVSAHNCHVLGGSQ